MSSTTGAHPPSWKLWHPLSGIRFGLPERPRRQALYPDLTCRRSLHGAEVTSLEPGATTGLLLQKGDVGAGASECSLRDVPPHISPAAAGPPTISPGAAVDSAPQPGLEATEGASGEAEAADEDAAVEDPPSTTLDYKMTPEFFRAAKKAKPTLAQSFWSYTLYRGPADEKVTVHYCRSKDTTERVCQYFLDEKVVGFDLEWVLEASRSQGARRNVSLVQLANQSRVALFHLALYPHKDPLVAPSLKKIMEDPGISKVGVNIKADCTRLRNFLGIDARGVFELSHLYRLVKYSASGETHLINKKLVSLGSQVQSVLKLPLFKGDEVRCSDWSKPLRMDQIIYSSSDAYAALQIYDILEQERLNLEPTPPRPYFSELGLPIRLAEDDTAVAAAEETEKLAVEQCDEGSVDLSDEAVESAASTVHVQIEGEKVDSDAKEPPPTPITSAKPRPSESKAAVPSKARKDDRVVAAERWLQEYRANVTTKPRAPAAALRAWHVWNSNQDLDPPAVAGLMRDPPLQMATVRTYILEAVKLEKLPYDPARLRGEVLDQIPKQLLSSRYSHLDKETKTASDSESGAS